MTLFNMGRNSLRNIRYIIILLILMIFTIMIIMILIYPLSASFLLMNPLLFPILMNVWWFLAIFNFYFKERFGIASSYSLLITAVICYSGHQTLRPSNYFPGYNSEYFCSFFILFSLGILFVIMQGFYGSRFFLPPCLRSNAYNKYMHRINNIRDEEKGLSCQICTNLLSEPELEYSDADPSYKWVQFDLGIYIQTECDHFYHLN
mmetsp:Transcript_7909/g.9060  ORF Transcript_7909/g.9060 Transcript_7909/m.9060 type:complete len:205 (+) Transcript_7909:1061-1675(+)